MSKSDHIEDYVEYLVQHNYVRELKDLSRQERTKLSFLLLLENNQYIKLIRQMHALIKNEVKKLNK
jgi:hypothetical protein